jgi:hypothetical protein
VRWRRLWQRPADAKTSWSCEDYQWSVPPSMRTACVSGWTWRGLVVCVCTFERTAKTGSWEAAHAAQLMTCKRLTHFKDGYFESTQDGLCLRAWSSHPIQRQPCDRNDQPAPSRAVTLTPPKEQHSVCTTSRGMRQGMRLFIVTPLVATINHFSYIPHSNSTCASVPCTALKCTKRNPLATPPST